MNRFVLDTSVAVSWFFEDETGEYTATVLESLTDWEAVVPSLLPLEVANVLLVAERRKRCSEAEAVRFIELLESLPITTDDDTARRALNRTYQLAREYGLTSYDATYLELAMRLGVPLATMDRQLADAAIKAGVEIFLQK
ncbi:MAG TPA: VapC toxin family PIN domain ribonuclease [Geobacter sp.]|nr:VapC toxin family PIN domain ribonuclease [Geobacter sp.]